MCQIHEPAGLVGACSPCRLLLARIRAEAAADGAAWRKHRLAVTRWLISNAARAKHQATQGAAFGRKLSPKLASQKPSAWRGGEQ